MLFLLTTPVSPQFINFLHLPIVDRFLRASVIYFQRFVEIWESLMEERAATMRKAPNPLARGHRSRYAQEMHTLRCVLGREYVDLVLGCQDGPEYHHMMTSKKRSTVTQSQGEKDLRIFEALLSVTHRVVWIALQRKHYTLIGETVDSWTRLGAPVTVSPGGQLRCNFSFFFFFHRIGTTQAVPYRGVQHRTEAKQ